MKKDIPEKSKLFLSTEIIRRLIYYGFCFIAIIAAFCTDLSPVVFIDMFEPDRWVEASWDLQVLEETVVFFIDMFEPDRDHRDHRGKARRYAESLLDQDSRRKIAKERRAEIDNNTITVEDATITAQWADIYSQLKSLKEGKSIPEAFKERLSSDYSVFFYRLQEVPINSISSHLQKDNQKLYIRFARKDNKEDSNTLRTGNNANAYQYLRLGYSIYSGDDFHLGTGLSRYPRPPTEMLYPYRQYSLWLILIGILTYMILPVRNISPKALRYPRWRVVLTDLVASIFAFGFFVLPLLTAGGFKVAVIYYFPFTAVFWFLCLFGIFMIKIALWYGSYQIEIVEDGLKIADYTGMRHFRFSEMEHFQPVIFKPPEWLIWLSYKGSAGRALLLSASESGAIGIRLKNGRDLFISVTDQMGNTALKGFEKILERLKEQGVEEKEEVREIRSMGMEAMR